MKFTRGRGCVSLDVRDEIRRAFLLGGALLRYRDAVDEPLPYRHRRTGARDGLIRRDEVADSRCDRTLHAGPKDSREHQNRSKFESASVHVNKDDSKARKLAALTILDLAE